MNIRIIAVGKTRTTHLENAIKEYSQRLARWVKLTWLIIPAGYPDKESEDIVKNLPERAVTVLLDERGKPLSTVALAQTIEHFQNGSIKNLVLVIGGASGVSSAVRKRADHIWKLSDMTFPHELVRLILIEQLYRVYDLNHGGNYHHS